MEIIPCRFMQDAILQTRWFYLFSDIQVRHECIKTPL